MPSIYELHEVKKPIRQTPFCGDILNKDNILTKTITTTIFGKSTLTIKLKSGETLVYEGVDKDSMDMLFGAKG